MKLNSPAPQIPDLMNLPKPRPGRGGGRKAGILALLALLIVGGAAFWLTRDPEIREQWREEAATVLDNATTGTPLAGLSDVLRNAPPPPPPTLASPPTAPGTLSGQTVQGSVAAPVDNSARPGLGGMGGQDGLGAATAQPVQAVAPKVTSDSRVRADFIEDLAAYLVSQYRPGPRGGTLAVSVQGVNQRYGVKMTGLSDEGPGGRAAILRYAFHPAMLQGLYGLYVDRFLEALQREAVQPGQGKALSPEQAQQLHMALAGRLVLVASGLEGVSAVPDLRKRITELDKISRAAVDVNSQMTVAVFDLDQLREAKADAAARVDAARARVDSLSIAYRNALEERGAAHRALVAAVRKGGGQALDEETLLFLALWVDRRLRQDPQALASVNSAAGILRDLARRCAQTGASAPGTAGAPGTVGTASPAGAPGLPMPATAVGGQGR